MVLLLVVSEILLTFGTVGAIGAFILSFSLMLVFYVLELKFVLIFLFMNVLPFSEEKGLHMTFHRSCI